MCDCSISVQQSVWRGVNVGGCSFKFHATHKHCSSNCFRKVVCIDLLDVELFNSLFSQFVVAFPTTMSVNKKQNFCIDSVLSSLLGDLFVNLLRFTWTNFSTQFVATISTCTVWLFEFKSNKKQSRLAFTFVHLKTLLIVVPENFCQQLRAKKSETNSLL